MKMQDAIINYLEWKGAHKPPAARNYRIWLLRLKDFTQKALNEITELDVVRFQHALEDGSFNARKHAQKTIELAMNAIRDFFLYWNLKEIPCLNHKLIKIPKAYVINSYDALTVKEYEQILSVYPERDTLRDIQRILVLRMLWDTGVRVSELCDMNIADIDTVQRKAVVKNRKNSSHRIVKWGEGTNTLLCEYLGPRLCLNRTPALFIGIYNSGNDASERMTPRSVQRIITLLAERAEIHKKLSPHCLRHGWAHFRRDKNAPIAFIQKGLGHRAAASTLIYEQYADWDFEEKAEEYLVRT